VKSGPASQVIFGKKRLIEFSLNVSNHYDAAYDVHLDVAFDLGLYMIRAVPLGVSIYFLSVAVRFTA